MPDARPDTAPPHREYFFVTDPETAVSVNLAHVTHVTFSTEDPRNRSFTFHLPSGESVTHSGRGTLHERELRERLRDIWVG